ncbi:MAG TPA: hypothetical protein VN718_07155 [Rhizomicrobium sp.]|nr:hypothetical protein [Rhizomicrobium sp.]
MKLTEGKAMKGLLNRAVLFALMAGTIPSVADPLPKDGSVVFSSLCESDGGDMSDYRVTITRQRGAMKVVVDFNDSGPDGKATARGVKYDQVNGKLRFRFKGDLPHEFRGTVSATALQGSFDGEGVTLPAAKAVPKNLPPC